MYLLVLSVLYYTVYLQDVSIAGVIYSCVYITCKRGRTGQSEWSPGPVQGYSLSPEPSLFSQGLQSQTSSQHRRYCGTLQSSKLHNS